ncbi:hypothetical protein KI387_032331, partial [Taxus chinensis]
MLLKVKVLVWEMLRDLREQCQSVCHKQENKHVTGLKRMPWRWGNTVPNYGVWFGWSAGEICCEHPNDSLYTFTGNLIIDEETFPISSEQILLRARKACLREKQIGQHNGSAGPYDSKSKWLKGLFKGRQYIATWYEEYRALSEKIRDAMSFFDFVVVSKERSRCKPKSQATHEEELGLQVIEKKQPIEEPMTQVEEKKIVELESKKEEEQSKLLGIEREQPTEALEAPIAIAKVKFSTDYQNCSVNTSQFDEGLKHKLEEIVEHVCLGKRCSTFNDISLVSNWCSWQIVEKRPGLHNGKEDEITKEYIHREKALLILHDYFQFVGNLQITVNDGQREEVYHVRVSSEDVPNKYQQEN